MPPRPEETLLLTYATDEHEFRRKMCGLSLIDQLLLSVASVRRNWSDAIEIAVVHTKPLSSATARALIGMGVRPLRVLRPAFTEFPLANKLLVGDIDTRGKDLLFLDCDTIVHAPVVFDRTQEFVVAFDALQSVPAETYREFFTFLGIPAPSAPILHAPAFEYYMRGITDQFPQFNSGVFYLRAAHVCRFFETWRDLFLLAHARFALEEWAFYLEQLAFVAAVLKENLNVALFAPGINFICTPRAPQLAAWPQSCVIVEHYAGDTSRPLVFVDGRIDVAASSLPLTAKGEK
jgi:hypothetical protein